MAALFLSSASTLHELLDGYAHAQKTFIACQATIRYSSQNRAAHHPLLIRLPVLALAACRRWLGLFLLRLFDFLFVSVVAFGHNDMRVVGRTGNVAEPLALARCDCQHFRKPPWLLPRR
ncbi:MAG: hypothetical protein NTY98_21755 [Verrucomicrobia bacterium]|nr:hypothetical protein [Verrucomicrobiota bacterium]